MRRYQEEDEKIISERRREAGKGLFARRTEFKQP